MRAALAALALLAAGASPALAQEAAPARAAGAIIGPVLNVTDIARTLRFYTDGLGMSLNMTLGAENRKEYMLGFGADPSKPGIILLHDGTVAEHPALVHGTAYERLVVRIADLDALAARLDASGIAHGAIRDVAMGYRMMMVTDPDGYHLELVQSGPRNQGSPHG